MTLYHRLFLFLILIFLSACVTDNDQKKLTSLSEARESWESFEAERYSITVEQSCFCPPPRTYRMTVENEVVVHVLDLQTDEEVANIQHYNSVEDWFEWLSGAIENDPDRLKMEFDPEYGFPVLIDYDQSSQMADEELSLTMENLVPE